MTEFDEWMKLALEEARQCGEDVPVGCVILKDGQLLSRGRNRREADQDPTAHAEMVAIRDAARSLGNWRLKETTLICTLEPCPMCAETILQSRISKLVYGAPDLVYGATGSAFNLFSKSRTFPIPEVIGGIMEEESRQLLKDFFRRQRAKRDPDS